eukprot:INCI4069.2.p1 GENE.INCI4069.2~~INCI4069.2.p1  ORF type:complete len:311 (-),score=47.21 INCI4069.2:504-1436(-)
MRCMWRLTVAVACVVLFLGSTRAVADGDADEYFKLMRQYLGEDGFARHPCLAEQERNGWTSTRGVPMSPFTVGVEGVGHHAIEVLLGGDSSDHGRFTTVKGNGGQWSLPTGWRMKQYTTKGYTHPDLEGMVDEGRLLIVLLRYPPSSLMSSVNRFQNRTNHPQKGNKHITGVDEIFTLHDSLAYVDAALRFPNFECGRLLLIPFEMLTQRPMALQEPLAQALQLHSMGSSGTQLLKTRLQKLEQHEQQLKISTQSRYYIKSQVCDELGLGSSSSIEYPNGADASLTGIKRIGSALKRDPAFLNVRLFGIP